MVYTKQGPMQKTPCKKQTLSQQGMYLIPVSVLHRIGHKDRQPNISRESNIN